MKKFHTTCALSAVLILAGAPALAQNGARAQTRNESQKTAEAPAETSKRVVAGTVSDYKTGHSIAVMKADRSVESFDLEDKDYAISVDPAVKVGAPVTVVETVQQDGKHFLAVSPKR